MLIVDTGPLVAYLNKNDSDHQACAQLLESRTDELLVTPYAVTEACYMLSKFVSPDAEINLIEAIAAGDLTQVDILGSDLVRIAQIMRQYRGFPLGIADASAVAIAERYNLTEVATLDQRHFRAVTPQHMNAFVLLPG
ncbi:MAG: PIN domain-containing protein [Longispora sp.]|nr:PIN domain-containing protein [Longispora sp. (in: high G+C Gram-positive bacteria)]